MQLIADYHLLNEGSFWPGTGPMPTADLGLHGAEEPPIECKPGRRLDRPALASGPVPGQ